MSDIYLNISAAPDRLLGRVDEEGRVYRRRVGPDELIGAVDPATGDVYQRHLGPDTKVGRVDLESGRVYHSRLGPDEYVGRVVENGRMYHHRRLAPDPHIGQSTPVISPAHTAAGMLLLVLPALEEAADPADGEE